MKKEDIEVLVNTPKKAKKVYKVLKMFKQPIFSITKDRLLSKNVSRRYTHVGFGRNEWGGDRGDMSKTEVSIQQLKQILAKEYLKKGDYIVCSLGSCDYIVEFKSFDEGQFPIEGSRYSILIEGGKVYNEVGRFRYFKRYATKKEIRMLKGTSENIALDNIKLGTWYKYPEHANWMACFTDKTDKCVTGYGLNAVGNWQDIVLEGHRLHTLEEVPFEEVKEALINEAKKRYKVGDKLKPVTDDRSGGKRVFSDDLEVKIVDVDTCVCIINDMSETGYGYISIIFHNGKWAEIIPDDEVKLKQGDYIMLKTNRKGIDQLTFKKVTSENKYRLTSCVKDGGHIHITDRKLINELDKY